MMHNPNQFMGFLLQEAKKVTKPLGGEEVGKWLDVLFKVLRGRKTGGRGMVSVLMTSAIYKALNPRQDIRRHQQKMEEGYSGRGFDQKYVTPFLKRQKFPSPQGTGWLTRAFETPLPYDEHYAQNITPKELKPVFLGIISAINQDSSNAKDIAIEMFRRLIAFRDQTNIKLARPRALSIENIIKFLDNHFAESNAARLPEIAMHSIYASMMGEFDRFKGKSLKPLRAHSSPDTQGKEIGDITVIDQNGGPFEAVEVKHNIPPTKPMLDDSLKKFQGIDSLQRFYLLSTSTENPDKDAISQYCTRIQATHGCQVIVNGVLPTINYFLRLLKDPSTFVNCYVDSIENESSLPYELKEAWGSIVQSMIDGEPL